jgi:hypothetical protein
MSGASASSATSWAWINIFELADHRRRAAAPSVLGRVNEW